MTTAAPDVSVAGCIARLDGIAVELDDRSKELAQVERELEPLEETFELEFSDFEAAMFERYEKGEGKWPGEETRERLFKRTLPTDVRHRMSRLHASRKRLEKRIGTLGKAADAQRSVLSALKVEAEASR